MDNEPFLSNQFDRKPSVAFQLEQVKDASQRFLKFVGHL